MLRTPISRWDFGEYPKTIKVSLDDYNEYVLIVRSWNNVEEVGCGFYAGRDFPTVGLAIDSPRNSNMSLCVDSGSVVVGLVYPSRDATVAAISKGSDGTFVGGLLIPTNMEYFSNDSSSGYLHLRFSL